VLDHKKSKLRGRGREGWGEGSLGQSGPWAKTFIIFKNVFILKVKLEISVIY